MLRSSRSLRVSGNGCFRPKAEQFQSRIERDLFAAFPGPMGMADLYLAFTVQIALSFPISKIGESELLKQ